VYQLKEGGRRRGNREKRVLEKASKDHGRGFRGGNVIPFRRGKEKIDPQ